MKVLLVHAHPLKDSYASALRREALRALRQTKHDVVELDLYRERFQPCLTARERKSYYEPPANQASVGRYVAQLRAARAVVFVFPAWWYGPPAILKGYLDRVWVPGVAFTLDGDDVKPALNNLRSLAIVTSFAATMKEVRAIGDPLRKTFAAGLRTMCCPKAHLKWMALYESESTSDARRRRFLRSVGRAMKTL